MVLAHLVHGLGGGPAEVGQGGGCIRPEGGEVPCAASGDFVGDRLADGLFEGPQHLQDRGALAGSEVPAADSGPGRDVVQGGDVSFGEVHNVDVVALGSAVRGVVVATEDHELFPAAYGHLGNERNEVVRDALGILADAARRMGADRVEVAQQCYVPSLVRIAEVGEDVLDLFLRAAVGVVGADLHLFDVGDRVVLTVHRGRRTEDDGADVVLVHGPQEVKRAHNVVVVVGQRFLDGLANGFEAREVDHGINVVLVEDGLDGGLVHQVHFVEGSGLAGQFRNPAQRLFAGVHEVVEDNDVVAGFLEGQDGMRTDIAGATGDKNFHGPYAIRNQGRAAHC